MGRRTQRVALHSEHREGNKHSKNGPSFNFPWKTVILSCIQEGMRILSSAVLFPQWWGERDNLLGILISILLVLWLICSLWYDIQIVPHWGQHQIPSAFSAFSSLYNFLCSGGEKLRMRLRYICKHSVLAWREPSLPQGACNFDYTESRRSKNIAFVSPW